jgi:putative heme iron utilization protein
VPGRPSVSLAQHERIVAAIVARDPDGAETAMRDHISSVIDALNSLPASQAERAQASRAQTSTAQTSTAQTSTAQTNTVR